MVTETKSPLRKIVVEKICISALNQKAHTSPITFY